MKLRWMLAIVPVACLSPLTSAGDADAAGAGAEAALQAVVAGDWRSAENRERDRYRHPVESLAFWGLEPGMSVLEIQPGGGWWTEILAPYAQRTGGRFYATAVDLANPEVTEAARQSRAEFEQRYAAKPDIYGRIELVNWGAKSAPLPANTFDLILTARSVHGWIRTPGMVEKAFSDFARALKPGGVLAVEQHRANPGPQDPKAVSGYVTEAFVIDAAEKAGLKLAARSEINANPKDTKDHPFGVWTLPPSLRSTAYGSDATDPTFDHSKYLAIGESDRMTLKFVKPQ
jgi:predicted methyltransferase